MGAIITDISPDATFAGGAPGFSLPDAILFYAENPVEWVKDTLEVVPDDWQGDVLRALVEHHHVAIRSGSGVGKSALMSWATLWFLSTRPHPKIPSTAPTQHQLYDVLWSAHSEWINRSEYLRQTLEWTQTRVTMRGHEATWFAVARTARSRAGQEVADALQGFHSEHLMYAVDEAPGVPEAVFVALKGALTGYNVYTLMAGNPSRVEGTFYDAFHRLSDIYTTFHVNSEDTPRVSRTYIDLMRRDCGPDWHNSMVYWIKVLGEFPRSATGSDLLIPIQLIDNLTVPKDPCELLGTAERWGLDTARYGKDYTYLVGRTGHVIHTVEKKEYADEVQIADWVMEYLPSPFEGVLAVETVSFGVGVYDILWRHLGKEHVVGFDPRSKVEEAQLRAAGMPTLTNKYRNARAAAWWRTAKLVPSIWLRKSCPELITDLAHITYKLEKDVIQIAAKEDIRATLGRSPDVGDAFMLTFAGEFASENAQFLINRPQQIKAFAEISDACVNDTELSYWDTPSTLREVEWDPSRAARRVA